MTRVALPLVLAPEEIPVLRSAMHDIQISIASYYLATSQTSSIEVLATSVRSTTAFIQVLNDLLTNDCTVADQYKSLVEPGVEPMMEIVLAFKYVRNVMQHVLHLVEPSQSALIGGLHGLRGYFLWADVPAAAHAKLHRPTQNLRPYFEQHLLCNEVTDTFMDALAAFATIAPQLVHRNAEGEWTGFPLPAQPGVEARLHPGVVGIGRDFIG